MMQLKNITNSMVRLEQFAMKFTHGGSVYVIIPIPFSHPT